VGYAVVDASDVEPYRGVIRQLRRALGVTAFGINQIELAPKAAGHEHDEGESNQEEVYVFLSGGGTMRIGDEEIEARPGRFVYVEPGTRRQPVAGSEGLSWVAVGVPRGGLYEPRDPF
jgi:mannose-6-phosphate isomerase-like protein (cupin superfamily)